MKNIQSTYNFNGTVVTLTWMSERFFEKFKPITQVYAVVFNSKGEILVCREDKDSKWQLPGGKPELGESIEDTLRRELIEEVDITVKEISPLGVQKVEFPNNPNKEEGDVFYQARLIATIDELLPQTVDPANGKTWERMFVPANEVTNYIKWGEIGETMFNTAIQIWNPSNK